MNRDADTGNEKVTMSFILTKELEAWLREEASRMRSSISWVARTAIERAKQESEQEAGAA